MLGFKPSLVCLMLGFAWTTWGACHHPQLEARLHCLEHRIARNHERIEALRSLQYKYTDELKTIEHDEFNKKKPKEEKIEIKYDLNSLTDLTRQRFSPESYVFKFSNPDSLISLTFHTFIQVDNDIFTNFNGLTLNDGIKSLPIIDQNTVSRFWINWARPVVEGTLLNSVNFFINPDFGQSQIRLFDGFVSMHQWRSLGVKVGKQTSLVASVENYVMASVYHILQPSFTTILAPNREIGAIIFGSFGPYRPRSYSVWLSPYGFDDWLSYQLGVFGGTADGTNPGLNPVNAFEFSTQVSTLSNKSFEGRVLLNPFINLNNSLLEGLALAFSGSSEIVNAEPFLPALFTPGLNPMFVYNQRSVGNGPRSRVHPTLFWHRRQFGILLDGTQTVQHLAATTSEPLTTVKTVGQINRAMQFQFTYNLTSEPYQYLNLVPERDFHFMEKGATGAWQVAMQLSRLWMDPSVFQDYIISTGENTKVYTFSDPRISIQKAVSFSLSLHWYWNKYFRMSTEYDQTAFVGGCSTGGLNAPVNPGCLTASPKYIQAINSEVLNRPTEKVVVQRIQIYF